MMDIWRSLLDALVDDRLPLVLILGAMFAAGFGVPVSLYLGWLRVSHWPRVVGAQVTGLCVAVALLVFLSVPPVLEAPAEARTLVPRIVASVQAPADTPPPKVVKKIEPPREDAQQPRESARPVRKVSKATAKALAAQARRAPPPQNRLRAAPIAVAGGIGGTGGTFGGARGGRLEMTSDAGFEGFAEEALEYVEYEESRQRSMREPIAARAAGARDRGHAGAGGSSVAQPIYSPKPRYPQQARKNAIEGFVIVRVLVSRTGAVEEYEIVAAEPKGIFDECVKQTLPLWKFTPARDQDGRPIEAREEFTLVFKLEDAAS